jgi:hypothetical protein
VGGRRGEFSVWGEEGAVGGVSGVKGEWAWMAGGCGVGVGVGVGVGLRVVSVIVSVVVNDQSLFVCCGTGSSHGFEKP